MADLGEIRERQVREHLESMVARGCTPAQIERYGEVTARNAAIQAAGPRPVDGVCFGKKGGKANGGE